MIDVRNKEDLKVTRTKEILDRFFLNQANSIYKTANLIKADHYFGKFWSKLFIITLLVSSILSFSLLMYYFTSIDCQMKLLVLPYLSRNQRVVEDIFKESNLYMCRTNYLRIGPNDPESNYTTDDDPIWSCCHVPGVYHTNKKICDPYDDSLSTCTYLDHYNDDTCFHLKYEFYENLVVSISYMQCLTYTESIVDSIQYTFYSQVLICLIYTVIRYIYEYGFNFSLNNLAQLLNNNNIKDSVNIVDGIVELEKLVSDNAEEEIDNEHANQNEAKNVDSCVNFKV